LLRSGNIRDEIAMLPEMMKSRRKVDILGPSFLGGVVSQISDPILKLVALTAEYMNNSHSTG